MEHDSLQMAITSDALDVVASLSQTILGRCVGFGCHFKEEHGNPGVPNGYWRGMAPFFA